MKYAFRCLFLALIGLALLAGCAEKAPVTIQDPRAEVAKARSHYENGRYQAAINILVKERKKNPQDTEINTLLNAARYKAGVGYYEAKEYRKAVSMFNLVRKGFEERDRYLAKTRSLLKELADDYYRRGLIKFREQKLDEAIDNWKKVLEYEPGHRKAKEYIEKSRKIQQSLEQHR